jgi:hypothetical protein
MKHPSRRDLRSAILAARNDAPSRSQVQRWQRAILSSGAVASPALAAVKGVSSAGTAASGAPASGVMNVAGGGPAAGPVSLVGAAPGTAVSTSIATQLTTSAAAFSGVSKALLGTMLALGLGGGAAGYFALEREPAAIAQRAATPRPDQQIPLGPTAKTLALPLAVTLTNQLTNIDKPAPPQTSPRDRQLDSTPSRPRRDVRVNTPARPERSLSSLNSEGGPPHRWSPAVLEALLIDSARRALKENPAETLTLARRHEQDFPRGALSIERRVLAIEAQSRLGRKTDATRALELFRSDYPSSAHLRRLDQLLNQSR